jgi:hypothetical protein
MHKKSATARASAEQALKLLESLTVSLPSAKVPSARAIKSTPVPHSAPVAKNPALPNRENATLSVSAFIKKNRGLIALGLISGGWGLLGYWLWRRYKKLGPLEKPIIFKVLISAGISFIGYGTIAFIPFFYWSKKLSNRRIFWTAFGGCFTSVISLIAATSKTPSGETESWAVIYACLVLWVIYMVHRQVYQTLKFGELPVKEKKKDKKNSTAKKFEAESPKSIKDSKLEPADFYVSGSKPLEEYSDSDLTTGDNSWVVVESAIFKYLAGRKGKQFTIEILSNSYTGIYFQGYSEPGGYITVEAASNVSVDPPLGIDNRKGFIQIGWEPPSDGLPNFIKFLDLKESENSAIAKLFVNTLQNAYKLELGAFKVEVQS